MNLPLLYQWNEMIDKGFPSMGRWQKRLLADFSDGVILAHKCGLNAVAKALTGRANANCVKRRLQRWLANDRLVMKTLLGLWIGWVLR